jgi:hypothetical protein
MWIDVFPFLLLFELLYQPVEGTCGGSYGRKVRQATRLPGIKRRKQNAFGAGDCSIIILTEHLGFPWAPLLAPQVGGSKKYAQRPFFSGLRRQYRGNLKSGSQRLHARAARSTFAGFCLTVIPGATCSSTMALIQMASLDRPAPRYREGAGASPRETASTNSRTLLKSRYAASTQFAFRPAMRRSQDSGLKVNCAELRHRAFWLQASTPAP